MRRNIYEKLIRWKESTKRKPLIVDGARQVGKTWIITEFGKNEFDNLLYINCDKTVEMKTIFRDFDTSRLIRAFSALANEPVVPGKTLIVLDEIQEAPYGITALKYFCEDAPDYHIVAAGSLLGVGLHGGTGFPVGKVDELRMFPMDFKEFLQASGNEALVELLESHSWREVSDLAPKFEDLLRQYYYVGGMPEAVSAYFEAGDLREVRSIQNRILRDYESDFSKHVPSGQLAKVKLVWGSVPAQLAKENKKFVYGAVKKGARAKDFEDAIVWLQEAGLVHKVPRVSKIEKPLKFYEDMGAFKLFACDLGLLGAMADVTAREVIAGINCFSEYKGAFTEQYIAQELIAAGESPRYFSKDNSTLEIDFIVQKDELYPIEVKAEENLRSKSLRTVHEGNPRLIPCRFSMSGFREQDWLTNVPLYAAQAWIKAAE